MLNMNKNLIFAFYALLVVVLTVLGYRYGGEMAAVAGALLGCLVSYGLWEIVGKKMAD